MERINNNVQYAIGSTGLILIINTSFIYKFRRFGYDNAHNAATNKMIQAVQNVALGTSNAPPINTTVPLPLHINCIFSS